METTSRILRIVSLATWVGSLIFFAFVVAPVAFHVLPTHYDAGRVVAGCLRILHWLGITSGTIFLLSSVGTRAHNHSISRAAQITLLCSMLAITCVSQFLVLPRMERDRLSAHGDMDNAPPDSPARVDFDRLHHTSEQLEGAVLLFGLLALALAAAQPASARFIER